MHIRLQLHIRCFDLSGVFQLYCVSKSKNEQPNIHTEPLVLLTPERSPTTVILSYLLLKSLAIWGLVQRAVGMWREGWYSKHRTVLETFRLK